MYGFIISCECSSNPKHIFVTDPCRRVHSAHFGVLYNTNGSVLNKITVGHNSNPDVDIFHFKTRPAFLKQPPREKEQVIHHSMPNGKDKLSYL